MYMIYSTKVKKESGFSSPDDYGPMPAPSYFTATTPSSPTSHSKLTNDTSNY
jgi:hypothetical protein